MRIPIKPGDVFFKLTTVEYVKNIKKWLCKCECGNTTFAHAGNLRRGDHKSCNCGKYVARPTQRKPNGLALVNAVKKNYIQDAKKRNYEWLLSDSKFAELIKQNCHYCGTEPSSIISDKRRKLQENHQTLFYNGIDRVDNTIGYIEENCVPCCSICNYAKGTLSLDKWLQWIEKAYFHSQKLKTLGQNGSTL